MRRYEKGRDLHRQSVTFSERIGDWEWAGHSSLTPEEQWKFSGHGMHASPLSPTYLPFGVYGVDILLA